jgi:hypothetical protein
MSQDPHVDVDRRSFLGAAGTFAAVSFLGGADAEGTTQMAHMVENAGAMSIQFTAAEASELNAAVRAVDVQGARLPEGVLRMSGVEAPPKG